MTYKNWRNRNYSSN